MNNLQSPQLLEVVPYRLYDRWAKIWYYVHPTSLDICKLTLFLPLKWTYWNANDW